MWIRYEKDRIYILQKERSVWLEHYIDQTKPIRKGNKRIRLKLRVLIIEEVANRQYIRFPGDDRDWTEIQDNLYSGPHKIDAESLVERGRSEWDSLVAL